MTPPPVVCWFRLRRNLPGLPFAWRATPVQAAAIRVGVRPALAHAPGGRLLGGAAARAARLRLGLAPAAPEGPRPGLVVRAGGGRAALVGAVDHLLLQLRRPGPPDRAAWGRAMATAQAVDRRVAWARVRRWGLATASPADAGPTGLRVVFTLALPGLTRAGLAAGALAAAGRAGLLIARDRAPAAWRAVPARPLDLDRPQRLSGLADALAGLAAREALYR